GEDILDVPVIAFGPEVCPGNGVDQLCGDAQALAGAPHAALRDVADRQLAPGLILLERARDDEQRAIARERGDNVFGDAVAEILPVRLLAHIAEAPDRDRGSAIDAERTGDRGGGGLDPWRLGLALDLAIEALGLGLRARLQLALQQIAALLILPQ